MVFKLKTSSNTMRVFEDIKGGAHLQPFALCKIAIALSLRSDLKLSEDDFNTDSEGLELNRQTITGEYDDLFKALIISFEERYIDDDEYFPRYVKAHIDRGAKFLESEYKYSKGNFYIHLTQLDKGI